MNAYPKIDALFGVRHQAFSLKPRIRAEKPEIRWEEFEQSIRDITNRSDKVSADTRWKDLGTDDLDALDIAETALNLANARYPGKALVTKRVPDDILPEHTLAEALAALNRQLRLSKISNEPWPVAEENPAMDELAALVEPKDGSVMVLADERDPSRVVAVNNAQEFVGGDKKLFREWYRSQAKRDRMMGL